MGYVRGLWHGMVLGAAIGVLYAPKPGTQTREQLRSRLETALASLEDFSESDTAARAGEAAREGLTRARQASETVASTLPRRGKGSPGSPRPSPPDS